MMRTILTCFLLAATMVETWAAPPTPDVSHLEIRDAILSLVGIFRDNSDKLERHEYRERQLGEQVKKALAGLDKRYRAQDATINQMAEHLRILEGKVLKNQEREQEFLLKISGTVENIQTTLANVIKDVESGSKGSQPAYTIQESPMEVALIGKLDQISASIERDQTLQKAIKETEIIVRKMEHRLANAPPSSSQNNSEIMKELEHQSHVLGNILTLTAQTNDAMATIPQKEEIINATTETFQEIREELIANGERGTTLVIMKLEEKMGGLTSGQEELIKATTEIQSTGEEFIGRVSQSYEQLLTEVRGLSKLEQVMIQTADNVMDTKRRVEYGVHQILLEVAELIKHQGKNLNGTVNKRFDDIELTILDNQSGALANLTTKIETEISQVWRQIGIMYQQLTASATALDRLQQQTDAYVNGSIKTMDSMESKVGMITSRMTEVDDNLNFLLGRLSMVTSEYNQIKSGLSNALEDIRDSFVEAENKLKDMGPGPRPIKEQAPKTDG